MVNAGYNKDIERLLVDAERLEEAGNYKMAATVLRRGAKLGNTSCQINLGNYYAAGTGVTKNLERAAHWYKTAYKNGDRSGALNLAIDKRNQGASRSAEGWFKKAVAMRDGGAYIELAKMYIAKGNKMREALEMLRQAIKLSSDDVSIDEKVEAKSLLRKLGGLPEHKSGKSVTRMPRKQPKSPSRASRTRRTGI
jgi:TPR repeat protein